ncbi:UDP-n-acetyl-D-mannosamine 6-dehydrogenase [Fusarium heterosporum]|uniref:UDP-n-acetyl-D-mannosamine 6-dehydrogenase n=1 Tax=Fusarium heterosporum TaxID=42747 RepID=A0A8H5SXK2_FUSHE|nr:UDP-n-acetyl-D-mannosamine 6-dehydrogenase [Fusarium heterosporum]
MPPSATLKTTCTPFYALSGEFDNRYRQHSGSATHKASLTTTLLIAVTSVGFVGTQLIDPFASVYNVLGSDMKKHRLNNLRREFGTRGNVTLSSLEGQLSRATHFMISFPTTGSTDKPINIVYPRSALRKVKKYARGGSTVVIKNSVAVGHNCELFGPVAKGRGIFSEMAPQRIDPGRSLPTSRFVPKIISELDDIVLGISKAGQSHIVNPPGRGLAQDLKMSGLDIMFADPLVTRMKLLELDRLRDTVLTKDKSEDSDLIVVYRKQWGIDFKVLSQLEGVDLQIWINL